MRKTKIASIGTIKIFSTVIILTIVSLLSFAIYFGLRAKNTETIYKEIIVEKHIQMDPFEIKGNNFLIKKGKTNRWYGIAINITGERRFEIAIKLMSKKLECYSSVYDKPRVFEELDDNFVIIFVDENDAICFFEYFQKYNFN